MKKQIEFKNGGEYDAVVAGAGTAGVFAAISAARSGAKTLLIEKSSMPGGTVTNAGVDYPGLFHAWGKQIIDGPCYEAIIRAKNLGGAVIPEIEEEPKEHWTMQIKLNRFIFTVVCEEMLKEAGVEVRYHCSPVFAECTENGVEIGVAGKNERVVYTAKTAIDATGDANIAEMAGFATEQSEVLQPATLIQNISGYNKQDIDRDLVEKMYKDAIENGSLIKGDFQYEDAYKAFEDGRISMHIHVSDAASFTGRTEVETNARATLKRVLEFVRSVPGGENVYVSDFAPECGVRETKRIIGEGYMTVDNYVNGYVYPDAVAYCFYPVDLHLQVGIKQIFHKKGVVPTIPYSALIPKGAKRMLVAGRCAAGDTDANSAYRVQAPCMAMGQAAGVAAALAAKNDISVGSVPLDTLRDGLKALGAIVPEKA